MNIGLILTGLFIVVTVLFIAIALYFPEWVGITGKKAQQYMAEHREESTIPKAQEEPHSDPRVTDPNSPKS